MRAKFSFSKVLRIAGREFASTALTKGFIIGALVVPAVLLAMTPLIVVLMKSAKPPADIGTLALIDRTGVVAGGVTERLRPESISERRGREAREALATAKEQAPGVIGDAIRDAEEKAGDQMDRQIAMAAQAEGIPTITVETLPEDADLEAQQARLRDQLGKKFERGADRGLLAVAVIDGTAVAKPADAEHFGAYELYTVPKLDDRTVAEIRSALRDAILERRYESAGLDRETLSILGSVEAPRTQEVTQTGTRSSSMELVAFLPAVFMFLILMGAFTGGQYLLTTTIEEKASRVVEVLLSAVSPMELMTGKILGQMGVGLSLLLVYNLVGIVALIFFERADLVSASTLAYMLVFFVLAYFMFASLLAAIGAAVNDLREAQSLMTPVMLMAFIPYILFMPITRDPNSVLSTTLSFVPPISPFVMMMRVASTDPPPFWQIMASIAVSAVGVWVCLWFAAKVFRVGLLMFGKPPNLKTLIRWVRMA